MPVQVIGRFNIKLQDFYMISKKLQPYVFSLWVSALRVPMCCIRSRTKLIFHPSNPMALLSRSCSHYFFLKTSNCFFLALCRPLLQTCRRSRQQQSQINCAYELLHMKASALPGNSYKSKCWRNIFVYMRH